MQRARRFLVWLPAVVWMALIYIGSTGLLAEGNTSRFLAPFLRWLGVGEDSIGQVVLLTRKAAHAAEYGLLAVFVLAALSQTFRLMPRTWSWPRAGLTLAICAAYAVSDEVHQAFVPSRYASAVDVLIDTAGAALALLALRFVASRSPRCLMEKRHRRDLSRPAR